MFIKKKIISGEVHKKMSICSGSFEKNSKQLKTPATL